MFDIFPGIKPCFCQILAESLREERPDKFCSANQR
jgi:hypothetical protein